MHDEPIPLFALLVEDDRIQASVIAAQLTAAGFTAQVAHDGGTGIEVFRSRAFHLAVVDLGLPDLPGAEVINLLRGSSQGRRIPIVALTASVEEPTLEEAIHSGADDVYNKSIGFHVLRAKFQSLAERLAAEEKTRNRIDSLERQIQSTLEDISSCGRDKDDKISALTDLVERLLASPPVITEEQIEEIATRAATKAREEMKTDFQLRVGKTVTENLLLLVGAMVIALGSWLAGKGYLRL